MQKKKLAIVYDAIYPYVKGGVEKRNYEIAKRLAKKNFKVHIYSLKWWKGKNVIKKEGFFLHSIGAAKTFYTKAGRRSIWEAVYFGFCCLKLLNEDFDVLEVNHMPYFSLFSAKLICLLKRKTLYVTWNEVWGKEYWKKYLGKLGFIAFIIEYLSAQLPDKIIAVSEHTKKKLKKNLGLHKKIIVIPNGIDIKEISRVKPAKTKSDIIFAGRLLSHKNVDVLIKSVEYLRKNNKIKKAFIIGDGPEREKLEKLTTQLKLEKYIKFINFLPNHNDLYSLMKSSKVFVFPSTREGFGIAALEANACGIPVVTVNHKDNATKNLIINGKNGYVTALSAEKFANKIFPLIHQRKSSRRYINFLNKFDWNQVSDQMERTYLQ